MEMPLRGFWTQPVEGAAQAIAYSGRYHGIRMAMIPNSAIVCTSDLIYPYELEDIHASKKKEPGERLAFPHRRLVRIVCYSGT